MIVGLRLPARRPADTGGASAAGAAPAGANAGRAAARPAVSRAELFATLYLLGVANALAAVILPALHSGTGDQAVTDVLNVATLAATAVGIHLLRQMPDAPVRRCDWLAAAGVALLLLVPHQSASWLAVIALALYAIGRDRRSPAAVAAGSIFLLLGASSYWGAVLGQAFGPALLALDAALAAALLALVVSVDVERVGNLIVAGDQTTLVMFWCSFLPNLLYGCLWWTVVARAARPEWRIADLLGLLAVGGLVVAVNTLRLALMASSADAYQWVHGPVGSHAFNLGLLVVIAAIALLATAPAAPSAGRRRDAAGCGEPVR